jgi:predicted permease
MKIKLALACAFVMLGYSLALLVFSFQQSNHDAWAFIVSSVVLTALLCIINTFVILYLLKLKTMNRYEIPRSNPDPVTDCPPPSGCQSKSAA